MSSFVLTKYRAEIATCKKYLEKAESDPKSKNIHRLRVSIKKLRALNKLVKPYLVSPGEVRYLHLLDQIFSVAGRLRETQINYQLVSGNKGKCWRYYRVYLKETTRKSGKELNSELKKFDHEEINRLEALVTSSLKKDKQPLQSSLIHLSTSLNRIFTLVQGVQDDQSLHSIRKNVRRAHETLNLVKGQKLPFDHHELVSGLSKLQDRIGEWHDHVILVRSLEFFMENQPPEADLSSLRRQVKKMQSKNSAARAEIFELVKERIPVMISKSGLDI